MVSKFAISCSSGCNELRSSGSSVKSSSSSSLGAGHSGMTGRMAVGVEVRGWLVVSGAQEGLALPPDAVDSPTLALTFMEDPTMGGPTWDKVSGDKAASGDL